MNLQFLVLKKHIFKRRNLQFHFSKFKFRIGTLGFFSLVKQNFELIYFKFFRKFIWRKFIVKQTSLKRKKLWVFLFPNFIYSHKSKNARMGAGVGAFVRVCIRLKAYVSFLELYGFPFR